MEKAWGDMYEFIDKTHNIVKGICPHRCPWCCMRGSKFANMKEPRLVKSELKKEWGTGQFLFIGSSIDLFADEIDPEWITAVLQKCREHENRYWLQSKNPFNFVPFFDQMPKNVVLCTTIESDIDHIPGPPAIDARYNGILRARLSGFDVSVTVEPILRNDLNKMLEMIDDIEPIWVSVGADSQGHNLPEPSKEDATEFVRELKKRHKVVIKSNMRRLLNGTH